MSLPACPGMAVGFYRTSAKGRGVNRPVGSRVTLSNRYVLFHQREFPNNILERVVKGSDKDDQNARLGSYYREWHASASNHKALCCLHRTTHTERPMNKGRGRKREGRKGWRVRDR